MTFAGVQLLRLSGWRSSAHIYAVAVQGKLPCRRATKPLCCAFRVDAETKKALAILGLNEDQFTQHNVKSAFRAKVKKFHPDVYEGIEDASAIVQKVIKAYEILTRQIPEETDICRIRCTQGPPQHMDGDVRGPREERAREEAHQQEEDAEMEATETEAQVARDRAEVQQRAAVVAEEEEMQERMETAHAARATHWLRRGCPYSCVTVAPHAFAYSHDTGCARAISQGIANDSLVQNAAGRCPRNCIFFVTPEQRDVLEELLASALAVTYYTIPEEAKILQSLIARANFVNNRFKGHRRKKSAGN